MNKMISLSSDGYGEFDGSEILCFEWVRPPSPLLLADKIIPFTLEEKKEWKEMLDRNKQPKRSSPVVHFV